MPKDKSFVDFVFQLLMICGKPAAEVNVAATMPKIVMESISTVQFKISEMMFDETLKVFSV